MTAVVLFLLFAVLYGVWALTMNPYRGVMDVPISTMDLDEVLTKKQAAKDIALVHRLLKTRHPAWLLDKEVAEQVENALEETKRDLPETITVLQLWQKLGRALHLLGDGHTRIWASPKYPLYLSDMSILQECGPPVSVQGMTSEQFVQSALPMLSYEMETYAEHLLLNDYLQSAHWMRYFGVDTTDGITMTVETEAGEQSVAFNYVLLDLVKGLEEKSWIDYEIDREQDLGVFTLSACIVNDEYIQTLDAFFQEVFENDISRIAVDLRGNSGGSSYVANLFLQYLDVKTYRSWDVDARYGWYLKKQRNITVENRQKSQTFGGTIYVFTDIGTFSAGKDFAMLLTDNDLAIHVGETPGNLPDCYIDILQFQLPNSGLCLDVSWKRVYRIDESQRGFPLEPDHPTSDPREWVQKNTGMP